jgi:tetratricopeptide (TPR) repeat protein
LGKTPKTAAILMGLWSFSLVRGMHRKARDLAEQALAIALSDRSSTLEVQRAHMMVGVSSINQGDLTCARKHLEECCAKPLPERERVRRIAEDPQIVGRGWLAVALARLGYLDQALATTLLNVRLAQESGQVRNIAFALNYLASVHVERREWAEVLVQGEVLIKLSEEQGLPQWLAAGKIYKGTATAYQSSLTEGAAILHRALQEWRATGAVTPVASYLGRLASLYGALGHYLDAMPLIEEAISLARECEEGFAYPELYEWKGELLLKSSLGGLSERRADAEKVLLQGLEIAHSDQVRLLELRIALTLTRLWKEQDKKPQALKLLSSLYNWFTEGFDTVDLREARLVLLELSQAMD